MPAKQEALVLVRGCFAADKARELPVYQRPQRVCRRDRCRGLDFCSLIVHGVFMMHSTRSPGQPTGHPSGRSRARLQPGQRLARGVSRHLHTLGFVTLEEFVPTRGLRVDVLGLGPKGELWVVECKSSREDFQSDTKWQGYLDWCDRYFWAVSPDFPVEVLPQGTGLILADDYDAELVRMAPEDRLAAPRRKKLTQKFAMDAARRLQSLRDPRPGRNGQLFAAPLP